MSDQLELCVGFEASNLPTPIHAISYFCIGNSAFHNYAPLDIACM